MEEVREGLRDIVRDGKRAGEVIARIRALTKRTAPPREMLDLNETIREVLALVGDQAKRNSVTIRTQFADDALPVLGDRVQLQQVVLNLVMNAMEAMSSVGDRARELLIITRNIDPDQVQVTVEDSGPGLDPKGIAGSLTRSIPRSPPVWAWDSPLAVPFFRTMEAGYGLLPMTAQAQSSTSRLPKYHEEGSHAGVAGSLTPLSRLLTTTPRHGEGLQRLIRSVGWKAETFASAQEFLARARIEPPSCVVLDLQLPGLSGLDLQKRMAEAGLETPIVFLTGHGNIPASVQAIKAGAIEFLTKPFDEQDLLRAIQEAIERDRRTRQRRNSGQQGSSL